LNYLEFKEDEYSQKIDLGIWKRILTFARPFKTTMVWLAIFMIFVAGVDIVMPLLTKHAIDNYIIPGDYSKLSGFAGLYTAIAIFQALNVAIFIMLAGRIESGVSYGIRKSGFNKLQELSFSFFDKTPVGWLMARMTTDTTKLSEIIAWGLVDLVWGTTLMAGIAVVMFIMHWRLALVVLAIVPLLAWISKKFQVMILKSYREVRKTNSRITASFNEGITGAVTSKTLSREDKNYQEFSVLTKTMYSASTRAAVQSALYMPLVQIASMAGIALAIWYGGSGVIQQQISYGMLVMFLSYAGFFFIPIQEMARVFAELQNAQASAERIISLLNTAPEIKDTGSYIPSDIQRLQGKIQFDNVEFEYTKDQILLSNFNLKIKPGTTVALVGETGGGKTTIASLICRFYEPTKGSILIDNADYTDYPLNWLQANLGVVLQTPHLFSGPILENIRYGRLDATDEEVKEAARIIHADQFIDSLSDGFNTVITEGGTNLSTGQKQMLSLARAILADPAILIMDEATSSIDTETEKGIQLAIEKLIHGRTSIIIAHRLSTIRNADRILVIKQGMIIEDGSHNELMALEEEYYNLYRMQFQIEATNLL